MRDYLLAIAIFVNGAKGHSALQLSRDLGVQYKTAFVLAHQIREAIGGEVNSRTVAGEVEIDSAYFGGYVKPTNYRENRRDPRLSVNQTGKRRVVVVMRERNGRSQTIVRKAEHEAVPEISRWVAPGSTLYADEAPHWDALHARYLMHRINHSEAYSDRGACTNQAESLFSRLHRAEIGTHHHIAGPYLEAYSDEMAWREDHRRVSNGQQYLMLQRRHEASRLGPLGRLLAEGQRMTAEPHVVTGLIAKRAELAWLIEHHQTVLRQLIIDLDHLDSTLRIFRPNIELEDIRLKPVPPQAMAFKGEVARIVLGTLREAGKPLTTAELAAHVMASRGLNTADKRLAKTHCQARRRVPAAPSSRWPVAVISFGSERNGLGGQ